MGLPIFVRKGEPSACLAFAAGFFLLCASVPSSLSAKDPEPPSAPQPDAGAGVASVESTSLGLGLQSLREGDFATALTELEKAAEEAPGNGDVFYFTAVAQNRLGKFRAALKSLDQAVELGSSKKGIGFERGFAYLKTFAWDDAITHLEAYNQSFPGKAQASEFLGRAYLAKGNDEKARAFLIQAMEMDPDLSVTAKLYLMNLEQRRGNSVEASRHMRSILQESPTSSATAVIRSTLGMAGPEQLVVPTKGQVTLTFGAGHDSNPAELPNDFFLDGERQSAFGYMAMVGDYDFIRDQEQALSAGLVFERTWHESQFAEFDTMDSYAYLTYYRELMDDFRAGMRVSDQFTWIGDNQFHDDFRNRIDLRPAAVYRQNDNWAYEAAYDLAFSDYLFPVAPTSDRDSYSHTAIATVYYNCPEKSMRLHAGALFTWNIAEGSDHDYDGLGFFLGAHIPLRYRIDSDLYYYHADDAYKNPNTRSLVGDKREDTVDALSVQLTRPIVPDLSVYVRGDFVWVDSNILVYDFHEEKLSGGVTLKL